MGNLFSGYSIFFRRKIIFVFLLFVLVIPQLADATLYEPGETLEPDCAPGSVDCGVIQFSLNGEDGSIQTLVATNSGADFSVSSVGNVHSINIPSASSLTRGLLTMSDWIAFNNKQTALGYTPLDPANNLSDILNAATARTNLGLGTLATQNGTFSGTSSGTNTGDQINISGNAGTATALQNPRTINGISFDGTADITITAAAGTLAGITLNSGVTASSLTSVGTLFALSLSGTLTGDTTLNLQSLTGNIGLQVAGTGTTGNVQIGVGGSGSATPDLLALDVKNTDGDPTGTNGTMYYNSNTGKFRCFENDEWTNCITVPGADMQHAASYDTSEALTNIPTGGAQTTLGAVSVTPSSATGDIYVTAWADVLSSNAIDQPFQLVIETTNNCTGSVLGNASVTYTITAAASADRGTIQVSGIAIDTGASAQSYSLCAAVTSGGGDTDVMNWGIEALVVDSGADLAEIYTTSDADLEPGDVVSLDPHLKTGIQKSKNILDQNVLGIVSTRPGMLIGGVDNEGVKALPVALSGRVPVKVVTENGVIEPGDYLAASSVPGVAMKANGMGPVIGQAMSEYAGENVGMVLAFVKNFNSNENPAITVLRSYFDETFTKKIHADEFCMKKSDGNEICITGDQINALLQNANIDPVANPQSSNPETPTSSESQQSETVPATSESSATDSTPVDTETQTSISSTEPNTPEDETEIITPVESTEIPTASESISQ